MTPRPRLAATGVICALAAAGCGLGAGEDAGDVELTVTRDYGAQELTHEDESISESDTVMRVLDRNTEIETRYGGGFVQSIDGLEGGTENGRRSDWFFYVNGIESPVGAADFELSGGDRVWWDYRDWTAAMRAPAVVGSWPEPFVHGFEGTRYRTELECHAAETACGAAKEALESEGVTVEQAAAGGNDAVRVLVGRWDRISSDADAKLLAEGPAASGVFAILGGRGAVVLTLLNQRGDPAGTLGRGAGLVAALRPDDGPPTWVVTGTDRTGVEAAAGTLGGALRNRYAVAADQAGPIGVPVP